MEGDGALVVGALLAFPLLVLLQDERSQAPVDPDALLPRSVQDSLAALDPTVAGWGSEALADAVHELLHGWEAVLAGGAEADPKDAVEGFATTAGAYALGEFQAGEFQTSRLAAPAEGTEGVGFSELLAAWGGAIAPERGRAAIKVIGLERGVQRASARLRVELASTASAASQLTLIVDTTWDVTDPSAPRLAGAEFVEGTLARSGAPVFVEITAAALAGDVLDQQLVQGLDHWRDRLDTRTGVGSLGHHGIAVGDVDGNGLDDLYLCQPGGLPNRLYLRQADGTAREVAAQAGIDVLTPSQSALLLDMNGDGHRDLVLAAGDQVAIFQNDGRGHFQGAAIHAAPGATSLCSADVDNDGDLDLFVCGYVSPYDGTGAPEPYHDAENGQANLLLLNGGDMQFRDGTAAAGLGGTRFSFAAAFEDVDDDGDQDLYVANDFGRNNLYRNDGAGAFVDVAAELGVEDLSAGMGVSFADVDGDGRLDLHVANMFSSAGRRVAYQRQFQTGAGADDRAGFQRHARGNSLFLNRGDDGFVDVSVEAGVTMGRWAWGAVFLDFENDGLPDLYVPNGFVTGARQDDL